MAFPYHTRKFAQRFLEELVEEGRNPVGIFWKVEDWVTKKKYGFSEAVAQKRSFRYPHQIKHQLNCGEAGVVMYAVAMEAGLEPRLFRGVNFDGIPTDHLFVDIPVGTQYLIADPLFAGAGEVTYHDTYLEVNPNVEIAGVELECITVDMEGDSEGPTPPKKISFTSLERITESQLHDQIRFYNSPEGFFTSLMGGQKIYSKQHLCAGVEASTLFLEEEEALVLRLQYFDRNLFYFTDDLLFRFTSSGDLRGCKRRLTLSEDFSWCFPVRPVFSMEQNVSVEGTHPLSLRPTSHWRLGSVHSHGEGSNKLPNFLEYYLTRKRCGTAPFSRPSEWKAIYHRMLMEEMQHLSKEIENHRGFDPEGKVETVDLRSDDLLRDARKLRDLMEVKKEMDAFEKRHPSYARRFWSWKGFQKTYLSRMDKKDFQEAKQMVLSGPAQFDDPVYKRGAYDMCRMLEALYAPYREETLRTKPIRDLMKTMQHKAKLLAAQLQ